jgi:nicotinamidase-related amidase
MRPTIALIIVDPQVDFIDPQGKLPIPGAPKVADSIAKFIKEFKINIHKIIITRDSHRPDHFENALMWTDLITGKQLPNVTRTISYQDIKNGRYGIADDGRGYGSSGGTRWYDAILDWIERRGEITLWPRHCVTGSVGAAIYPGILDAVSVWELYDQGNNRVEYLDKGMESWLPAYSAFSEGDFWRTQRSLQDKVKDWMMGVRRKGPFKVDYVVVCGFAEDYCVAACIDDLIFGGFDRDLVIPKDLCAPILTEHEHPIYSYARYKGVKVLSSYKDIAELPKDK